MFSSLELALASAVKKKHKLDISAKVVINRESGDFKSFRTWEIVSDEDYMEPDKQKKISDFEPGSKNEIGDLIQEPLEEVNSIIKKLLNESMDEVTRLGALAARLKIIRSKIDLLYERKVEIKPEKQVKRTEEEKKEEKPKKSEEKWIRLKMLEAGEVNGKQIDKGVILDVKEEDGKKLVESKKAEVVEEVSEGASPIQKSQDTKKEQEIKNDKKDKVKKSLSFLKNKAKTLEDIFINGQYIIADEVIFNQDDIKLIDEKAKKVITDFKAQFEKIDQPSREILEPVINGLIKSNNTNFKGVGQPLRIVLTGSKFGPGIYDIILSLGKKEVQKRLDAKIA